MRTSAGPNPIRRRDRRSARVAAAGVTIVALLIGGVGVGPVQAAPPTTDPTTSAEYGARWLASQVTADGFIATTGTTPNYGNTLQTALSLALTGVEEPTFDRMMAWITANAATVIQQFGADDPGRIGIAMMLADSAGIDPAAFGGVNLPARLQASLGTYEISPGVFVDGLYGSNDPSSDGAFRQAFAILGQSTVGAVPPSAINWLEQQQCDATNPEAAGGWQPFRADPSVPCVDPDPAKFSGADTNSTAMAVAALAALGPSVGTGAALDFLETAMLADGSFPFIPGLPSGDPNSTALAAQAIDAAGEDPSTGRWAQGAVTPITYLIGWQIGCDAPAARQGAFSSPFVASPGDPDVLASIQAVWGVSGATFPIAGPTTFRAGAVPCLPPTTTTTSTPTTVATTAAPTTSTSLPASPTAQAVSAQPTFTG